MIHAVLISAEKMWGRHGWVKANPKCTQKVDACTNGGPAAPLQSSYKLITDVLFQAAPHQSVSRWHKLQNPISHQRWERRRPCRDIKDKFIHVAMKKTFALLTWEEVSQLNIFLQCLWEQRTFPLWMCFVLQQTIHKQGPRHQLRCEWIVYWIWNV